MKNLFKGIFDQNKNLDQKSVSRLFILIINIREF